MLTLALTKPRLFSQSVSQNVSESNVKTSITTLLNNVRQAGLAPVALNLGNCEV